MGNSNGNELTNTELALLNNLLYINGITDYKDKTLKTVISKLRDNGLDKLDNPKDDFDLTAEEWDKILTAIEKNPKLADLEIKYPQVDDKGGKAATFVDSNNNATVVFRGTAGPEWADNVLGGYKEDTEQQKVALEYIKNLPYTHITVSGHSKGGNKAQYVTIVMNSIIKGKIDRCVAFDGQGFSPEFCKKYAEEIKQYNNLITLIGPRDDYVNILLYQIAGNVIYTEVDKSFWDRLKDGDFVGIAGQHIANRMIAFDEDGNPYLKTETSREPIMTVLHEFLLYLENHVTYEEKQQICEWGAKVLAKVMNKEKLSYKDFLDKDGRNSIKKILTTFKDFLGEIDSDIKQRVVELLKKIILQGKLTKAEYKELESIMELIAENVDSTYSNSYENYSSSGAVSAFTAGKGAYRDFTEGAKEQLISLVKEVEDENPLNITRWDVWYRVEKFFGHLNIKNYSDDINTYYRKLIDINGTTVNNIENIFRKVNKLDISYRNKINENVNDLIKVKNSITALADSLNKADVTVEVK